MLHSPADWQRRLVGKTDRQMAEALIEGLSGYRRTSVHRATDTDSIAYAIQAIRNLCEPVDAVSHVRVPDGDEQT
jgi:hypothetical protein